MLQNNLSECFEHSLNETKHFHLELACVPLQSLEHPAHWLHAWNKVTQSGWVSVVGALCRFLYRTQEKGCCSEHHQRAAQSLRRRNYFCVSQAGDFTCSTFVMETSLCESMVSKDWLPVCNCLLVSETHLIMDCLLFLSLWLLFYLKYFISSSWNW